MRDRKLPYEDTRIAKLLRERITRLAPRKTQRQIAFEIGYQNPNVLSMYKRGESKVPLERVPAMAKALEVDIAELFKLGLEQWWPDASKELSAMFSERVLTTNERGWLLAVREAFPESDPAPTPGRITKLKGN